MNEETKKKITDAATLDKLVEDFSDVEYVTNDNEFVKVHVISTNHDVSPKLDAVKTYLLGANYRKRKALVGFETEKYLPYIRPYEKNDKFMECKLTCTILPKDAKKIEAFMQSTTFKNEVERHQNRREIKMKKSQRLKLAKMKAPTKGDADRLAAKAAKGAGKGTKDGAVGKKVKAKAKAKGPARKRASKPAPDGVIELITNEEGKTKTQERAQQSKKKAQVSQEKNVLSKKVKRRVKNYKVAGAKKVATEAAKTEAGKTEAVKTEAVTA